MKALKVEVFTSDEAYYSWLNARKAGLRVSKYTPIIVPEDDCTTAHIIVKCKRLDTAIKHAKEAFADYSDVVEALEELEHKRAEDKHVTGISDRYNTISTCYNGIDGEYSFYIVVEARDEVAEASEDEAAAETTAKAVVVEPCPHCESEIEMQWDVKKQGYKATCPVCGKRLMLCDACQHRGEDGELLSDCDYDSATDTCRFNSKGGR